MPMERVLGLDIGGANLKAAHVDGTARLRPFALWKQPQRLGAALSELLRELPAFDRLAVTMTGELCDCFETSRQGVLAILAAVQAVAGSSPVHIWQGSLVRQVQGPDGTWYSTGELAEPGAVRRHPLRAAGVNWLALATYVGRFGRRGPALLLDVGSTTTDVIPLAAGRPAVWGWSDPTRLRLGELVYSGVRRTPVCALLQKEVAAELFATTLDAYLVLGEIPEEDSTDTADGRPATVEHAHGRLARMLCRDRETCTPAETRRLAGQASRAQRRLLARAVRRVARVLGAEPRTVILAGSGEFLARQVVREDLGWSRRLVSLARRLGPELSRAACAYAVAVLAAEGRHG
jgi:probable H4MPT-linked C1 transfer pathway protein